MERAESQFEGAEHGNQRERGRWDWETRLRNFLDEVLDERVGK